MATKQLFRIPKGNDQAFFALITHTDIVLVQGALATEQITSPVDFNNVENLSVKLEHRTCGSQTPIDYKIEQDHQGLISFWFTKEQQVKGEYALVVSYSIPNEQAPSGAINRLCTIPLCVVVDSDKASSPNAPIRLEGQAFPFFRGKDGRSLVYDDLTEEQRNDLALDIASKLFAEYREQIKGQDLIYANLSQANKDELADKVKALLIEQYAEQLRGRDLTFESLTPEQKQELKGEKPQVEILEDGHIHVDSVASGVSVLPTIGANGNWFINGQDTGQPSRGENFSLDTLALSEAKRILAYFNRLQDKAFEIIEIPLTDNSNGLVKERHRGRSCRLFWNKRSKLGRIHLDFTVLRPAPPNNWLIPIFRLPDNAPTSIESILENMIFGVLPVYINSNTDSRQIYLSNDPAISEEDYVGRRFITDLWGYFNF